MPLINGSAIKDGITRLTVIFSTYVFIGYVIETICFSADSFALSPQLHIVLIYHYVHRVVERGGNFSGINRGICRGYPLSPVMAALYLLPLDTLMTQQGIFYRRYMDDIIIFCKTRWQLRKAVAKQNQKLSLLKLTKAPDKTFIGSIERGFSFLGYLFRGGLLQPAEKTMQKYRCRLAQLYEQKKGQSNRPALLASYQQRRLQWVHAGLEPSMLCHAFMQQFCDNATANRISLKRIG